MSSKSRKGPSRKGPSRPRKPDGVFDETDMGAIVLADGIGLGMSVHDDGSTVPSVSLYSDADSERVTMMLPLEKVRDLDAVIDTLTRLREEHFGKRG